MKQLYYRILKDFKISINVLYYCNCQIKKKLKYDNFKERKSSSKTYMYFTKYRKS